MQPVIWNKKMECAHRHTIEEIQLHRLKKSVELCYHRVPLYKEKFDAIVGLKPEQIRALSDLKNIPFTVIDDIRANYPFGMLAVDKKDVVRIHGSSGTTGKPKIVGYTRNDIDTWSEVVARVICAAGCTDEDVVQISFGYGLFTGGFGLHYGCEKVGAMVIPVSSGNTERQLMLMQDLGSTVLVSTPAYALYMADVAEQIGVDKSKIKLRLGMFGGEGHTNAMRDKIEEKWNILVTENYGLSELIGPGVSGECYLKDGMHIAEDHFLFEIIDPDTGEVLPEGEQGEVVITGLTKEAVPILRYRTGDISSLNKEPCKCGRTSIRMDKVRGRTDDMMIIRGVNIYPSQIESVLMSMKEVEPHYEIIATTDNYIDKLEVKVEISNPDLLEKYTELDNLRHKIAHKFLTVLGIDVKVTLVSMGTLQRFEGKARRVTDLRNR